MKNRILGALILAVVMVSTTFATDIKDNVSQKALHTFTQKFNDATSVHWVKAEGYYKAMFTWNNQHMFAYIGEEGEILGVARNVVSSNLPINLQTSLIKDFPNSWITELYEFSSENETHYYVTIENADQSVTLKSVGLASWSVYKKVKK